MIYISGRQPGHEMPYFPLVYAVETFECANSLPSVYTPNSLGKYSGFMLLLSIAYPYPLQTLFYSHDNNDPAGHSSSLVGVRRAISDDWPIVFHHFAW